MSFKQMRSTINIYTNRGKSVCEKKIDTNNNNNNYYQYHYYNYKFQLLKLKCPNEHDQQTLHHHHQTFAGQFETTSIIYSSYCQVEGKGEEKICSIGFSGEVKKGEIQKNKIVATSTQVRNQLCKKKRYTIYDIFMKTKEE